jgi:hypothetical protein
MHGIPAPDPPDPTAQISAVPAPFDRLIQAWDVETA